MVICLERGADLRMPQLMPLPLTVSCFSKIQFGFTFLVLAHLGSPEKGPLNGCACVCVRECVRACVYFGNYNCYGKGMEKVWITLLRKIPVSFPKSKCTGCC